jgi:von Willebrand factor type A domain/Aerotolerance regulator N-terminal
MARPTAISNLRRMWFPFALVACLLVMIPGAVLFFLNLIGRETDINRRLESTFRLSYHIPIPWWGALAMFLVPPLLILLYFLKLKRKPIEVPSTFLWKKSIEDLHVNSLFQWLRNNILLILQLLVLLAMIYAILAPRMHGSGGTGKHYILMIDNSASMSATDMGPSRLEWAKAEAIKEIDAAGDDDVGMLLVFNSRAEIRQSYTTNRSVLRQRVRDIEPTQRTTQIREALDLADSLANPRTSSENEAVKPPDADPTRQMTYAQPEGVKAEVHLYSDGRFPDEANFALGNLDLRFHLAGRTDRAGGNNQGIVTFNAVRDESDAQLVHVHATLVNHGEKPVTCKFEMEVRIDGELKKQRNETVTIPPARPREGAGDESDLRPGERSIDLDVSELDDQKEVVMHAVLKDINDAFAWDNEAWLVLGVVRKARVLIIGPSNRILHAFFDDDATKAICEVAYMSDAEFKDEGERRKKYSEPARTGAYDLMVFDRVAPPTEDDMPRANTFFIGVFPPPLKIDPARKIEKMFVKGWASQQTVLRYLTSLHEIGVGTAYRIDDLPPKTPRLLEAEDNLVLMFSLTRGPHTDVVQTFALLNDKDEWNTNWPLQPSFPIFWRNVLYSLGNLSDASTEDPIQPGMPKRLRPGGAVDKITVTDPTGRTADLERVGSRTDFDFQATDHVGVYIAEWKGGGRSFVVNLLDAEESNIQPRDNIRIGDSRVTANETQQRTRELWKWAVVIGLLFLLVEWWVYNKRIYV